MTTKGRTKTKKRAALSVPEIDVYRAVRAAKGVKLTRKQAAANIERNRKAEAERQRTEDQERGAKLVREMNERAKADVDKSLRGLVDVRELLYAIATENNVAGIDNHDVANIALSHFEKCATELEQALFQLSAWNGCQPKGDKKPQGWFREYLKPRLVD